MPYEALKECLEANGLEQVNEGIWLYWSPEGPYLYTCRPDTSGDVYMPSALSDLWIQLPQDAVMSSITACLEELLD